MNTKPRLTGEPIMRILCKTSENLVGYLYQWNNGDVQPAWFDGAMADGVDGSRSRRRNTPYCRCQNLRSKGATPCKLPPSASTWPRTSFKSTE